MATRASTIWKVVRAWALQRPPPAVFSLLANDAACTAWEIPRGREHVEWSFCSGAVSTHFVHRTDHGRCRFCGLTTTILAADRAR